LFNYYIAFRLPSLPSLPLHLLSSHSPERDKMIETHDGLAQVGVCRQVSVEESVFGDDIKDNDLPVLCAEPQRQAHTTHGRDLGLAHWE
jgi:hypothetical protein